MKNKILIRIATILSIVLLLYGFGISFPSLILGIMLLIITILHYFSMIEKNKDEPLPYKGRNR